MELNKAGEEYQKLNKEGLDVATRAFGEVNHGFQTLFAEMTSYSKRTFDEGIRAWEQLLGVKSIEQAVQIQSQYAKNAYEDYVAEMSKLGNMYVQVMRNTYAPVEKAVARKIS